MKESVYSIFRDKNYVSSREKIMADTAYALAIKGINHNMSEEMLIEGTKLLMRKRSASIEDLEVLRRSPNLVIKYLTENHQDMQEVVQTIKVCNIVNGYEQLKREKSITECPHAIKSRLMVTRSSTPELHVYD